jgi:hypothetical protein
LEVVRSSHVLAQRGATTPRRKRLGDLGEAAAFVAEALATRRVRSQRHAAAGAYTSSTSWPIAQRVVTRSRIWARSASRRSKFNEMRWKRRHAEGVHGSGDEPVSPAFRDISRH